MHHLTKPELKLLLAAVPKVSPKAHATRNKCMVLTTYWHGFRVTEVVGGWVKKKGKRSYHPGLTPSAFSNGIVTMNRLKGSNKTNNKLMDGGGDSELNEIVLLEEVMKGLAPNERLFPMTRYGFYKLMRRAGALAGLPKYKCHPHALKHTICKHTIKAGIENLRNWVGHKTMASTGEYLKVDDDSASDAIAAAAGGS